MNYLKPIRTEIDYEAALARIEVIFDSEPGTPDGDEAEVLTMLISQYEDVNHNISPPDPIEAIRFRIDQLGINQEQLAKILEVGSGRMSEFMSGTRGMSVPLLRKVKTRLQVPAESLIADEDSVPAHIADAELTGPSS